MKSNKTEISQIKHSDNYGNLKKKHRACLMRNVLFLYNNGQQASSNNIIATSIYSHYELT